MLRNRSRTVRSKQGLMVVDPSPQSSSTGLPSKPRPASLFPSPRLFVGFSPDGSSSDFKAAMSPTSILDTRQPSSFFLDGNPKKPLLVEASAAPVAGKPIGLGIVAEEKALAKGGESRMVLFGSQLKVQIPAVNPTSIARAGAVESPRSPIEFGIKNRDSQLVLLSPARRTPLAPGSSPPPVFTGSISTREMELSEDYTCVIARGPNPRTTHIFDNCVVESCGDGFAASRARAAGHGGGFPWDGFLSFCHGCKKDLEQGTDIFIYRGEKAFCSTECRYLAMLFDEGINKPLDSSLNL